MAVLLLEKDGKLSLDDDIRKLIPEIPAHERPITIRHLLTHTSGMRDYLLLFRLALYGDDDFYTDYYSSELDVTYKVVMRNGDLAWRARGGRLESLEHYAVDTFHRGPVHMVFERRDGKVTGLRVSAGRVKNIQFVRR